MVAPVPDTVDPVMGFDVLHPVNGSVTVAYLLLAPMVMLAKVALGVSLPSATYQ